MPVVETLVCLAARRFGVVFWSAANMLSAWASQPRSRRRSEPKRKKRAEEEVETLGDEPSEITGQRIATASAPSPASVANTVTKWVPDSQAQQDLQGATVLWVDDNPDNNRFEREAFQAIGIRFELSTSTEDALRQLDRRRFNAIISDMGRGEERQAGYELLERLRQTDRKTPFFIYAGASAVRHREDAIARGAQGSTNSPKELMALVIGANREPRKR